MPAPEYKSSTGEDFNSSMVSSAQESIDIYRNGPEVWNEASMPRFCRTAALNITVSACSCTHGLEKSKDIKGKHHSWRSSNVLLLQHPKNPFPPLFGAGDHCHRTVLLSACLWGKAKTKDTSSPRPLVMGMTSLAEGELQ